MAEHPFMPLATDAYLGDTTHLTTTEHGAYLLLLMAMWRSRDGALPNDDKFLARVCRLTTVQWARVKPTIMAFLTVTDGGVTQDRLMRERAFVRQHRQSQSDKANARWRKEKENMDAAALPVQCPPPTPHLDGKEEPKGSSKKPKKPAARAHQVPDDFQPSADGMAYAASKGMAAYEVPGQVEKFIKHHQSKGNTFKDVGRAWQTWCLNFAQFRKDAPNVVPLPGRPAQPAREVDLGNGWVWTPGSPIEYNTKTGAVQDAKHIRDRRMAEADITLRGCL